MNNEILSGIENAVARGYTLQQAMQSFFNAGYPKQEIEEAARQFMTTQNQKDQLTDAEIQSQKSAESKKGFFLKIFGGKKEDKKQPLKENDIKQEKPKAEVQKIPEQKQPQKQSAQKPLLQNKQPIQKISAYEPPKSQIQKPKRKEQGMGLVILLIIILLLLLGVLAAVILFKEDILAMFDGFLSLII